MAYYIDVEISLISETITKDEIGQDVITPKPNLILARLKSVGQSEFFQARQSRLSPTYTFETNPVNYNGEKLLIYNDVPYSIYRTYRPSADVLEIYAEEKVGDL